MTGRASLVSLWALSERSVDEVAHHDALPRWASLRLWLSRRRMLRMIDEGEALGRGEALRNLFGARVE